jgi:DNA (cytosine-5)-methyltransferase 1
VNGLALRPPSTCISVCSGVGGLDLGLHAACGVEPVVYIEREAHAAAVLVARMEEAVLPAAPVWDNLLDFDARPLVGLVDLVAGGTPCQDLSLAGRRCGLHGERSRLFFEHVRLATECAAPFFFWENVGGAVGVVPLVAEHLHAHGYTAVVWCVVRARDVGAPHERARVFLLAYSPSFGQREPHHDQRSEPRPRPRQDTGGRGGRLAEVGVGLADSEGLGRGEGRAQPAGQQGRPDAPQRGGAVANPERPGLEERRALRGDGGQECPPAQRGGLGLFPPARDDREGWARVLTLRPELAPARPQPRLRGLDDGLGAGTHLCVCPREDRLRAAGNGVVPQQAALAWRILWGALGERLIKRVNHE